MKIQVKLFATLKKYISDNDRGVTELVMPEPARVCDVLDQLGIPGDIPKIILVNGVQKEPDDILAQGDCLSIFPPIAGG